MGSNIQEQLEIFLNTAVQKKDEEIKNLKDQNDKLREENERLLKQISGMNGDIKHKAENLKKALDDFLEHPTSNRTPYHQRYQHHANFLPVSIPNSNVEVKPSTSTRADESPVNGSKYNSNRPNFNSSPEDFSSRQEFRTESDAEIINQANPTTYHIPHSHSQTTTLPTPYKRFNPNANGFTMNGANNNNNNNNRSNRNNSNNNNSNKHTIFVSWPGTATKEQLTELFEHEGIDVADIRYTAQKQFAHVDLKSENAVSKAITLNGVTKNDKLGQLRVEVGKPRSNNPNPTENGQRSQNQNKNFSRQNNKNLNGYNSSSPQKQSKFNPYNNNHHNNNNHHVGFPFTATDDKENNSGWQSNDIPKSESA